MHAVQRPIVMYYLETSYYIYFDFPWCALQLLSVLILLVGGTNP